MAFFFSPARSMRFPVKMRPSAWRIFVPSETGPLFFFAGSPRARGISLSATSGKRSLTSVGALPNVSHQAPTKATHAARSSFARS